MQTEGDRGADGWEGHHFNEFQANYQRLVDDYRESEVITKNAEQVITNAQVAIATVQTLIQVNEQKLTNAKKKLEELEVTKKQVQKDLVGPKAFHSSFDDD